MRRVFRLVSERLCIRKRWGETEYVLAALPLGGYVRMASRDDEATAFIEGGSENAATQVATKGEPIDPNAMMPFGPSRFRLTAGSSRSHCTRVSRFYSPA